MNPKPEKDRIHIESNPTLGRMQGVNFASDFRSGKTYRPIYDRKSPLELFVEKECCVTLALLDDRIIIGYAVLGPSEADERWARGEKEFLLELKAVEVLREFRGQGLARQLLGPLFSDPTLHWKIIFLTAYSWLWDLEYSGLTIPAYRNMLLSLYSGFGFKESLTNEPNICLKPENIFMVREGKEVPPIIRERFKWLRFNILV